jgi:hypothetical protein
MRGQAREASRRSNEGIKLENLAIFLALSTVRGTSMGQGVLEKKRRCHSLLWMGLIARHSKTSAEATRPPSSALRQPR